MAEKTRASTLQQRFGFVDDDLKTPGHDAIMVWLTENLEDVCAMLLGLDGEWRSRVWKDNYLAGLQKQIDEAVASHTASVTRHNQMAQEKRFDQYWKPHVMPSGSPSLADLPAPVALRLGDPVWERPVMSDKYMIGFIDLAVSCTTSAALDLVDLEWMHYRTPPCYEFTTAYLDRVNQSGAFLPVHAALRYQDMRTFYFEVKSKLPSVGELIRQIRMYEQYVHGGKFVVVSPDARWASVLESQNIASVQCPG